MVAGGEQVGLVDPGAGAVAERQQAVLRLPGTGSLQPHPGGTARRGHRPHRPATGQRRPRRRVVRPRHRAASLSGTTIGMR
ncbi:hypothetical protein GCM10025868_37980 [Angustibacter aerolatus]|uniref:Uncharacterized protein n=1 Tax=Angustibacter aerolatus TaxID=1162965 RepID=A0ABQ6JME3_9ACTN|nr:hypothetical protein GCM10025868_37980 [Angustibacter aerolatus]